MKLETDSVISDAFEFERKRGRWLDWPDICTILYGCEANYGRSVLADIITHEAISSNQIPPFYVRSGSLVTKYNGVFPGLHPLTAGEISRRKGRPLYSWELAMYPSKPLSDRPINTDTDVILFVDRHMTEEYIDAHLGPNNTEPRSIICYPLSDPSSPPNGETPEIAIRKTARQIEHFVFCELKQIITNVRRGIYDNPQHRRNRIYYPLGLSTSHSN